MANEVKLIFKVTDDGTLKLITDKTKKAKKATDDLTNSTNRASDARNRYNKAEKGAAGLGANATKNFSKMNQTMGGSSGLVAAYATLAANAFALTAALGALSRAAAFEQLANGLKLVGSQAGQNLPYVANQLKDITNGALSAEQALRATAVATSSGFSTDQLVGLTKVAKGASVALGRDLGDALDRLVRGTAKLEPEILDELGIIVRLDDATTKYAASIGKLAGDLNTFERQQAFLNATVEQGEKKYGALADRLDTNPYEKLAAAFNDLAKSILTGVNTVLGPFAEFLSQNSFALFGALTAFTASITRALFPALTGMAEKAAAIHVSAAAAAKRSGKVISATYKKQQAEVVRLATVAGKALPPSFAAGLPKLEAGKMGVRELTKLLNNLKKSEALRAAALKKQGAAASAEKQKELANIRALRAETEKLIAAESSRATVNQSGAVSRARSQTGKRTANAIGVIENQGAYGGLKVAVKNAGNEFKAFQKTAAKNNATLSTGAARLATLRAGLIGAGGAARVFGAALLNAIPVIGQVLFAVSILAPYISDMLGFGKTDPVEKATKSFKSFSDISIELSRNLALARTEGEKNFLAMKAGAGVIGQVTAAFNALSQSQIKEAEGDFDDAIKARLKFRKLENEYMSAAAASQEKLTALEKKYKGNPRVLKASGSYRKLTREIELYTTKAGQYAERAEFFGEKAAKGIAGAGEISQIDGIETLLTAINRLETAPDAIENFPGELALLKDALNDLEQPGAKVAATIKKLETDRTTKLGITKATDNATATLSQFNTEVTRLGQKAPTQFQKATDFVKQMSKDVNTLKADTAQLNDFLSGTDAGKSIQALMDRAGVSTLEEVGTILEENNSIIANSATAQKENEQIANRIKQASASNAELTKQQIIFERRATEAKIAGLEAEIRNTNILTASKEELEQVKVAQRKINQLKDSLVDSAEENFRIEQASIKAAQRQLGFDKRRAAIVEKQFQTQQKLLRLQLQIDRARASESVNPIDEYRLAKNAAEEQKTIEDEKAKLAAERIRIEFRLLDNQLLLEQKRMERLAKEIRLDGEIQKRQGLKGAAAYITANNEANALEQSASSITGIRTQAASLAAAEEVAIYENATDAKELIDQKSVLNGIKADQYRFEQRRALIQAEAEYYKLLGATELGISQELSVARENLKRLEEERAELLVKGLDTSAKDVEIQKAKTTELQKQLDLINAQTQRRTDGFSFDPTLSGISQLGGTFAEAETTVGAASGDNKAAIKARDKFKEDNVLEIALGSREAISQLAELEGKVKTTGKVLNESLSSAFIAVGKEMQNFFNQTASNMAKLGPDGEAFAPFFESLGRLTASLLNLGATLTSTLGPEKMEALSQSTASLGETFSSLNFEDKAKVAGAAFAVAAEGIGAISSLLAAKSQIAIRKIDEEIAAEKKRDGKSKESLAKIKQLEAKKEAMKKKEFETQKKLQIAQIIMSTAAGIAMVIGQTGIFATVMVPLIAALGAAQLAIVSGMSYQGGGGSIQDSTPSKISMGDRRTSTDLARSQSARGELAYFRGESGTGGPENFRNAFTGMKYRANGGNTAFMVGEQGPELFMPDRPGTIVPNDEAAEAAPTNVSFNINTVDATGVEDLLVAQRGNIIGMIRDAANSYGQDFVEEVDTSVFNDTTRGVARY